MGGNDDVGGAVDDYYDYDELVVADDDDADDWYTYENHNGGFEDYTPRAQDPGQLPFIVTFCYCFLLICLFPLFIALRQRIKQWRNHRQRQQQQRKTVIGCTKSDGREGKVPDAPKKEQDQVQEDPATESGVSVESLYFEVGDGLTTLDTRQYQNQILILSTKQPIRASRRHAVGNLLRSSGTPLRRFAQRWRCKSNSSKTSANLMIVDEQTHVKAGGRKRNNDTGVAEAPIVVYQPLQEKSSSDSEAQSSSGMEEEPNESGGMMETVISDFVDDIKEYNEDTERESTPAIASLVASNESPPKYTIDVYKGKRPFFVYFCSKGFRRKVKKCAAWDFEMYKILKLAAPFTLHAIATDVCDLLEVVVISQLLGTSALSAYFAVEFMVTLGTMIMHGAMSSLTILCSQAIGASNTPLAGRYVQISILFHQIIVIPLIIVGWDRFDDVVEWVGFDEGTGEEALKYARFAFFVEAINVYDEGIHYILEATDRENYSSALSGTKSIASWLIVFCAIRFHGSPELWMVGAIHIAMTLLFLSVNVAIVVHKQWLDGYWRGLIGSVCFSDTRAIMTFFRTALPLALGYVIEYCEWEILFIFASIQGPAEVAVWGLLGSVWDVSENIGVAVADAAEMRVANLLGRGKPAEARHSAHKSILIGTMTSLLMSLAILSVSRVLPRWVTPDATLQAMFQELLPQMCLGLAVLTFGTMSWSILCAQGRSSIAAAMCLIGSLGVTLPCALISTLVLNYNLHGLLTSVVLGYATSSVLISICMVSTNWKKLADKVRRRNKKRVVSEQKISIDPNDTPANADAEVDQTDAEDSCSEDLEYDDYDWDELPDNVRTAAAFLGYTEKIWDNNMEVDALEVPWEQLSSEQQEAASVLGYNQVLWETD